MVFGGLVLSLLCAAGCVAAEAQTAQIAGQLVPYGSALTNASGTAADASQNVYVVTNSGAVYREAYSSLTAPYSESQLFTTSSGLGTGIAVDSTGTNIYVGAGSSVVQYTLAGGSYSVSKTFAGFTGATIPAVDASGNVFIADEGNGSIYKESFAAGSYSQARIATGFSLLRGLAVDVAGDVFVSDFATSTISKLTGSGTAYSTTALSIAGLTAPMGLGVDAAQDLFIETGSTVVEAVLSGGTYSPSVLYGYTGNSLTVDSSGNVYLNSAAQSTGTKLIPYSLFGYTNFGSVAAASPASMTIAFTLTSPGILATPNVVTQGLSGYDFTLGTGGTCAGGSFLAGMSCTVVVKFQPLAAGPRSGAVILNGPAGAVASGYVGGVGLTPLGLFHTATLKSTISTTLMSGRGMTLDPAGDIYVAQSTSNQILKFLAGSTTSIVVANTGTCFPVGTAIDGMGNLYYNCNSSTNIYELVGGSGPAVAIPVGYSTDDHLSADSAGNLYTTSYVPSNLFLKVMAGTHAVVTLATAPVSARFVGAITDSSGNTFAPDFTNNILYELPAGSNTLLVLYSGAPLRSPHAIAEDAIGNLYVTSTTGGSGAAGGNLLEFSAQNYSATPSQITLLASDTLAIAANGDIYTVYNNSDLYVYTRSTLAVAYPNTAVGQTSATQSVLFENDGTAPLQLSVPSSGTNPSLSTNFSFDPSSTCPLLSITSSTATLAPDSTCTDVVAFAPLQAGAVTGSLIQTDNSLGVAGAMQPATLIGTGIQGTPLVTVASATATLGNNVTLSATVSGGGVPPAGALTFQVGSGPVVAATCVAGSAAETCTAAYPTAGFAAGANPFTANVAADANYLVASGTAALTLTAATTSSVTSSLNPSAFGSTVTFTGTVASAGGTPDGTISFLDGSTLLGTRTLSGGVATLTVATLSAATHPITISYAGAAYYTNSTSTVLSQVVSRATGFSDVLGTSNAAPSFGTGVMLTDTIATLGGVAATGTVSFYSGTTLLGTASLNSGVATLNTTLLPVGTDTVTATYPGDLNYSPASSNSVTETVGKAGGYSDVLTASASSSSYAQNIVLTDTLPMLGGVAPTGTVTFYNGALLLGTGALSNGVATLNTTALPVGSDLVTAVYPGDGNFNGATSNAVPVAVSRAAVTSTDMAAGMGTYGAVTSPATVTIPYSGSTPPGGAVTLSDSRGNTVTVAAASCTAGNHVLTCSANLPSGNLPVGNDPLSVAQAADANYAGSTGAGSLTISSAAVSPIASSSSNAQNVAITQGAASTLLTVVIPYSGAAAPSGAVTLGVAQGAPVAATCSSGSSPLVCTASVPTSTLPVGTYAISARQAADANYPAGSGSATLTVGTGPVSPLLNNGSSVSDITIVQGASTATLTATIAYTGPAPTGALTFTLPGLAPVTATCTNGRSPLTCTANYPAASLPVGTYTITASEAADANYPQGNATGILTVQSSSAAPVSPILSAGSSVNNVSVPYGTASTTLSATIAYSGSAPAGAVSFLVAGGGSTVAATCVTGAASLTCTAPYPTQFLGVGSYTILATEAADANYSAGRANGTLTVTQAGPAANDTGSGSGTYGQPSTTVQVAIPYAGNVAPGGAVTVTDSRGNTATLPASSCSAANNVLSCPVILPTANVPAGTDAITISQAADPNYAATTGSGVVTIAKASVNLPAPVILPLNAPFGTSATLSETVPAAETGTVRFFSGSTLLGTAVITNGVASLTTTALPAGTDQVTAAASGDTNYLAATSPATTDVVATVSTNVALASSRTPSTFGSSVTLSATVTSSIPGTPAGTVTFYDGSTVLGMAALNNGVATLTTLTLAIGTHPITAVYGPVAGSILPAATSAPLTQVVASAVSSTTLTASLNPVMVGQPVTFSATVPATVNGLVPTGSVLFYDGTVALGTAAVNASGVATLSTSSLASGTHPLTAAYSGDSFYAPSTSNAVALQVSDFTLSALNSSLTVDPGSLAAFNLVLNPANGVAFSCPVVLSLSGLPASSTATFNPATVTPGSTGTTSTLFILTYAKLVAGRTQGKPIRGYETAGLCALAIPLCCIRRKRLRLARVLPLLLLCLGTLGLAAAVAGCSGGYFGPAPASYPLTVTGTCGTLQHSTTVTLNVN